MECVVFRAVAALLFFPHALYFAHQFIHPLVEMVFGKNRRFAIIRFGHIPLSYCVLLTLSMSIALSITSFGFTLTESWVVAVSKFRMRAVSFGDGWVSIS